MRALDLAAYDPLRHELRGFLEGLYNDCKVLREGLSDQFEEPDPSTSSVIATFRHQALTIQEHHREVNWPRMRPMGSHDPSAFAQLREIEEWAFYAIETVCGGPPKDRYAPYRSHPNWTHGIGRLVRLFIRDEPAKSAIELKAAVEDELQQDDADPTQRDGVSSLPEYLSWLARPYNGSRYSAFNSGRGYFMDGAAYAVWIDPKHRNNPSAAYRRWLQECMSRRATNDRGALPFGYWENE